MNTADATNNAASVNRSTQSAAAGTARKAGRTANAAESEATRQLNQQQATGSVNAGATVH